MVPHSPLVAETAQSSPLLGASEIKTESEKTVSASGSASNENKHNAYEKTEGDDGVVESAVKEVKETQEMDKGKGKERAIEGPSKPALSEYEKKKHANIEENRALLKELFPEGSLDIFGMKPAVEKKVRVPKPKADLTQRRTSARHPSITWVAKVNEKEDPLTHRIISDQRLLPRKPQPQ